MENAGPNYEWEGNPGRGLPGGLQMKPVAPGETVLCPPHSVACPLGSCLLPFPLLPASWQFFLHNFHSFTFENEFFEGDKWSTLFFFMTTFRPNFFWVFVSSWGRKNVHFVSPDLPGRLSPTPYLRAWIEIDPEGLVPPPQEFGRIWVPCCRAPQMLKLPLRGICLIDSYKLTSRHDFLGRNFWKKLRVLTLIQINWNF